MCSHEWKFRTHACNKGEVGLSGLGWVGLVDHQVHCRQMVEGRYGVLFIIVSHLQETPIIHCTYSIYEYAYSCIQCWMDMSAWYIAQVAAHTKSTFIYVRMYICSWFHTSPIGSLHGQHPTLCICKHMLPPQVQCILGSALWILLLYV